MTNPTMSAEERIDRLFDQFLMQPHTKDRKLMTEDVIRQAEQAVEDRLAKTFVEDTALLVRAARADERRKTLEARFRLERMIVFKEVEAWLDEQAQNMGAVDGYDYRSGEEYAYRNAAVHFKKAYDALAKSSEPGEDT